MDNFIIWGFFKEVKALMTSLGLDGKFICMVDSDVMVSFSSELSILSDIYFYLYLIFFMFK
jgi:hypothetical protein